MLANRISLQLSVLTLTALLSSVATAADFGDLNCDTAVNVVDVQMSIMVVLNIPLNVEIDGDQNGLPDACGDLSQGSSVGCGEGTELNEAGNLCVVAQNALDQAYSQGASSVDITSDNGEAYQQGFTDGQQALTYGCINLADGESCDDQNACTESDTCMAGMCVGTAVECSAEDNCSKAYCDPKTGCQTKPACDDAIACTQDTCKSFSWGPLCDHIPVHTDCDDSDPCSVDQCYPLLGGCTHDPTCDDQKECTIDACTPDENGGVSCQSTFDPKICDDGNECTTDFCNNWGGCENMPTPDSYLHSACCDPYEGKCQLSTCVQVVTAAIPAYTCDLTWGPACAKEAMKHPYECSCFEPWPCSDGEEPDLCTESYGCFNGECQKQEVECNDLDGCTMDSCDKDVGCVFTPVDCDDGVLCTADSCKGTSTKGYECLNIPDEELVFVSDLPCQRIRRNVDYEEERWDAPS